MDIPSQSSSIKPTVIGEYAGFKMELETAKVEVTKPFTQEAEKGIQYLPIYMVPFLQKKTP